MMRRILILAAYFWRTLVFSLAGVLYIILALIYWAIFFPPSQGTPDVENYVLVIGAFGAALTFLATLTVAARANRAENYPLLVRLPSRVEYIAAVFLSAFTFALLLQLIVAALALIRGPAFGGGRALEIPPLWIAPSVLAAVLALHASDLVTKGWSRVIIYGVLALLLLLQSAYDSVVAWLADGLSTVSRVFYVQDWVEVANSVSQLSAWLRLEGAAWVSRLVGVVFWPFHAAIEAVFNGYFTPTQALAPAVIVLYATILFLLAADLFATKDLELTE